MHIHEILNAIYANHLYEYLVIDSLYNIIEHSDKVFELCQQNNIDCNDSSLMDLVPEFIGMEEEIESILQGEKEVFILPYVSKGHDKYIHIYIHPGKKSTAGTKEQAYETVIILFENISQMAITQQSLVQERNEKSLLLDKISEKNMQLKHLNEHMQMLVQKEIKKNLEKQKLLELKSRHSQMGEMIAMITHQWKQPLNVINLIVNILKIDLTKRSLQKSDIEKKFNDILKQVGYMDQTVNDFQNFFNPFKEKIIFNIHENIQAVLDLVKYEYIHKNIELQLTGNTYIMAYGFPNEFNQVILSLLKNSKDAFGDNPHQEMMITIHITEKEKKPTVTVTDNARGIPEEIVNNIFDLYVTTKEEGSGLGLNIAKSMIEKHMEGEISVENIDGGAHFSITLPPPPSSLE
jgi:signal transduction histidine kinase